MYLWLCNHRMYLWLCSSLINARATVPTSDLGAQWWYNCATAITTCSHTVYIQSTTHQTRSNPNNIPCVAAIFYRTTIYIPRRFCCWAAVVHCAEAGDGLGPSQEVSSQLASTRLTHPRLHPTTRRKLFHRHLRLYPTRHKHMIDVICDLTSCTKRYLFTHSANWHNPVC